MENEGSPTLGVGFVIDTGASFDEITRLQAVMDSAEVKIVKDAAAIERATGGMINVAGATASVTAFGNAATRELQSAAAQSAKAEKAGEALSRQLEKQASTYGLTTAEIRKMRTELAATAAQQAGLTELAGRLRAQEQAIYNQEFAAARKAAQQAEDAAQEKVAAAAAAVAATEREAQAVREAGLAYQMFEAAARKGMAALRDQQAAEAAATKLAETARARADAEAAVNAQLLERSRLEAAIERNTGLGRPSATDSGATYSALAAKAADDEARAQIGAANAADRAAREHAQLAAMVQVSHDAQVADAEAAERLRMSTDPLYASLKRLDAEIAESNRLYIAGATPKAEYERQQGVLNQRVAEATIIQGNSATAVGKNATAMKNLAIQMPDVIQGIAGSQPPLQILIQQGGQLVQVAMMTEGGLAAMAGAAATLAIALAPLVVVAGLGYVAFSKFQASVKDSGELTKYRDSLGLTHKEMLDLSDGVDKAGGKIEHLTGVTVTAGDVMSGIWKTIADNAGKGGNWDTIKKDAGAAFDWILEAWQKTAAGITAGINGLFNAVKVVWNAFPAVFSEIFVNAANLAIDALNKLVKAGVDQLNLFIAAANLIPGIKLGSIAAPQIAPIDNPNAGAGLKAAKAIGQGYVDAYTTARKEDQKFWSQVGANARQSAKDRMKAQADAEKANRTAAKPKVDHNALNAEAVEAQIRNLYKLAAAYDISGAAALIAEAREKAESQAIKARADVEAAVDRQVRLAVAQRVADAAKSAHSLNEQAQLQTLLNDQVEAGLVPAARANQMLQDRLALQPLIDAQGASDKRGDTWGYIAAAVGLAKLTAAQKAYNDSKAEGSLVASSDAGKMQLEQMQEELRLVGATDEARARALATLKAEQEIRSLPGDIDPAKQAAYVKQQSDIAAATVAVRESNDALNLSLSATADLLSLINDNAQNVAGGLSDAFGSVGEGVGKTLTALTSYAATQAKLDQQHKADQLTFAKDAKSLATIEIQYAKQTAAAKSQATMQAIDGVKSLFAEHSAAYKIMQGVEEAYAAFQAVETILSIARDATKTASSLANSAVRTTANTAEGASKIFADLGPWAFPVVAAMVAVIAALGFSHGSGGSANAPTSPDDLQKATGTGTVLGSPNDKSASIAHSLDLVAKNTSGVLQYSNAMLDSLKSIDASIGVLATTIARQLNVSGVLGDTSKLNLGSSGSGGILGLFASSTTRSLYDAGITLAATTVGNIVAQGISGQTYQIVEQVKKSSGFLGIGGGTKTTYQTSTGALPTDIASSIQSVIASLENGIVAAAGQIGVSGAKAMLDNFQVNLGKISFNGLDAQGIQDELNAVFSSVGDNMVNAILPGLSKFQKAGEGLFETLERVSSTVVAVDAEFKKLGVSTTGVSIDIDMAVAGMFDSVSDFTSAADAYFSTYYSTAEQATAQLAEMQQAFQSLGLSMPASLDTFRQLVSAQDLTTAAGQATYATLLKLAPAFADLESSMNGAKSAADIASEKDDLQRQLLQLQGDTDAIRALDLAKIDPSNRALQQQIWALSDAQDAAKNAQDLADAWKSVGDSIMDEVKRIRGLNDPTGATGFAALMGQFNAASTAARAGDQDAAKSLPGLSQSLLQAAQAAATSRQELDRIQAQTAASLEATYAALSGLMVAGAGTALTSGMSTADLLSSISTSQTASTPSAANDDLIIELKALRQEVADMRSDNNTGHAANASANNKTAKILDNVTLQSGGDAISTVQAA